MSSNMERLLRLPIFVLVFLALGAQASRLDSPSPATSTTIEDGAYAALYRPSPTPTPQYASVHEMELLRRQEYTMGADTCGFGSAQRMLPVAPVVLFLVGSRMTD
jgi:hypothetical protein